MTCSLTGAGTARPAAWRAAVRRGSSSVAAAAAATSAALTVMATTIPETNVPLAGALPRTPCHGMTVNGRIIWLSSCSTMWQWCT